MEASTGDAPTSVLVRRRRESDMERCLEMARSVHRQDGYPPLGPIDVPHFLAPPPEIAAWVAEIRSQIVGHVALHNTGADVTLALATQHTGLPPDRLDLVVRVLVAPTARRCGAARIMLGVAVEHAHARGQRPVLDVATRFGPAIALYESAGWERAGEVVVKLADEPPLPCFVYVGPPPGRAILV
jgi:GNAT superfamily N-acetyltransferase